MSIEEQVTVLEQGLTATQRDFLGHLMELNRSMAILNKVVSTQELNGRDIDHNLTVLLGIASEQGRDIKAVKDDLGIVKGQIAEVKQDIADLYVKLDREIRQDVSGLHVKLDRLEKLLLDRLPPPQ